MPITLNNVGNILGDGGNTSISLSITVGAGSNRALVAFTNEKVMSLTYAGNAMTLLDTANNAGGQPKSKVWLLTSPPVGTANLVGSRSDNDRLWAAGFVVDGFDAASTPTYASQAAEYQTSPESLAITAPTDGMVVGIIIDDYSPATGYSAANGATEAGELAWGGFYALGLIYKAAPASSLDWTWAGGDEKHVIKHAIALTPSAGGGGGGSAKSGLNFFRRSPNLTF